MSINHRTFHSPQKERKVGSPLAAPQKSARGSRAHIKTLTESDLKGISRIRGYIDSILIVSVAKPNKNEKDIRQSQTLTKAETESILFEKKRA